MHVAVVTGSAKGLGRDIAIYLAKKKYIVVAHFNKSKKEASNLLKEISKFSPKSSLICADLKDTNQVQQMFKEVHMKYGHVNLLINNVGNFIYKNFSKITNAEFKDVIESNLYSTLFCSREVLVQMRKKKTGHIINIGAAGAERFILRDKVIPYFMAKNSVYLLTKAMAKEEGKNGIHINMVSPTSMRVDIFKKNEFPMGREAKHTDIIKAIGFLLSEDAYYINGANIEVSGGFIAGAK